VKPGQKPEKDWWRRYYWRGGWEDRLAKGHQITDEAIRQLKKEPNAESIIYDLIEAVGVEVAREIYCKVFEPVDAVKIEQTIEQLYCDERRCEFPRSKIEVPERLLLWIFLREGFGGRKRGRHKGHLQRRHEYFAIEEFKERARELHKGHGLSVREAKEQAAEEISKSSTISVASLLEGRFYRRRAPRKKKKKSRSGSES